jgi:hypothetical protein
MSTQWLLRGATVLAAFGIATADVAAQAPTPEGTWTLDAERSENVQEMLAARTGGGPMMRAGGDGAGAGAVRGGGGGGGRMIVRGGGALVGSFVQAANDIALQESFRATTAGEIAGEVHISFPSMGGSTEIVAKRVYVKSPEAAR